MARWKRGRAGGRAGMAKGTHQLCDVLKHRLVTSKASVVLVLVSVHDRVISLVPPVDLCAPSVRRAQDHLTMLLP